MKATSASLLRPLVVVCVAAVGAALNAEPPPQLEWARQYSIGANVFESFRDQAADASGVYSVGQIYETAYDALVQKRSLDGTLLWSRTFATSRTDTAYAVAVDATGVYVGGWAGGALPGQSFVGGDDDAFVRKYDFDGNEIWTRQFGSKTPGVENYGRDHVGAIALTADAVYVAGACEGPLPGQTYAGGWDGFVRKYDKAGNALWTVQFGTSYDDNLNGIAADAGGVYVIGLGGTPENQMPVAVRKFDSAGALLWTRTVGDPATFNVAVGLALDETGLYVHGTTRGTIPGQVSLGGEDNFVRKYSFDGDVLWTRQYGSAANDSAGRAVADATGVIVALNTNGTLPGQTSAGGTDIALRKYDRVGNEVWTFQFGTAASDETRGVASSSTGLYTGSATLGAFPGQTSGGNWDAFVAKLQRAPTANAGTDVVLASTQQSGYTLSGAASDPDDDALTFRWFEGTTPLTAWLAVGAAGECALDVSSIALGTHVLTLKVTDGVFTTEDSMTLEIVDEDRPVLAPVASPSILWPPNHLLLPVTIQANATDNSAGALTFGVTITSNEPANGLGDGDLAPDWEVVSIDAAQQRITVRLRAERAGLGAGRIYSIVVTATDSAGNVGSGTVYVLVPSSAPKP